MRLVLSNHSLGVFCFEHTSPSPTVRAHLKRA
eukprot:COSAG06_NODE_16842_length_977_cov_1.504556_2_plen_31_part_01